MSLAWWSKLIDKIDLENGKAECGIDIWGNFAIAYQYLKPILGIRSFYPVDSDIPESERIVIERNFSEIDKVRFYDFVKACYDKYRLTTLTPITKEEKVEITPIPAPAPTPITIPEITPPPEIPKPPAKVEVTPIPGIQSKELKGLTRTSSLSARGNSEYNLKN